MEAEEAAVEGQEVAAERDAVPDAGLQEVQAGVGIYRGSAFLEDGHYAAEDVASGTMFAADGAITLHNSLVAIQLDNAMENVSAGYTEKDNVSYSQRAGIGQGLQFHRIPVSTYEGEHAHSLDGDGYILAFAEDPEDFREKYVIADNYFLHNCLPVYLPDYNTKLVILNYYLKKNQYLCFSAKQETPARRTNDHSETKNMKIKDGFVLREICGEKIISGEGLNQVNFSKFIRLNDSAAFLLKKVEHEDFTAETLAKLLCEEYEISEEIAAKDAEALCKSLVEAGIVEE